MVLRGNGLDAIPDPDDLPFRVRRVNRHRVNRAGAQPLGEEKPKSMLNRGYSSLLGNVILCELFFAVPMFVLFSWLNYSEDSLTPTWALWIALVCILLGALMALIFWYCLFLPLIKRRQSEKGS